MYSSLFLRGRTALCAFLVCLAIALPAFADTFIWQPVCNTGNPLWYDTCFLGNSCPGDVGANYNNWGRSVCQFGQLDFPDFGDDAVVSSGHATMNLPANITNLSVSSSMSIHHLLNVTGSVSITGVLDFQGEISGAVQTTVAPGAVVTSNNARVTAGTFVNRGTLTHTGPGGFDLENGAHLINNGNMLLQNNSQVGSFNTAAVDVLTNNSMVNKSGPAGTFGINNIKFNNTGTVDIQTGILEIYGNTNLGTNIGAITIAPGATLQFNGSGVNRLYVLGSGGSITGGGKVMNLTGTLWFSAPYTIADLENLNGNIVNHAALDITTRLRLRGVDWSGGGTTTIAPGALMEIYYGFDHFGAHTFINNGTLNWGNSFGINVDSGFVLNNAGLWEATSGGGTGPGVYTNTGTMRTQNGFSLSGSQSFTNSGLVHVLNSSFIVDNYTQTAGTTRLQPSSSIFMTNGNLAIQGGILEGTGTLSAPVVNSGGIVSPGLSIGYFNSLRGYTQASGATLRMELGGTPQSGEFDTLAVNGSFPVVLDGTLEIGRANGYLPQSGHTFDIISHGAAMRSGQFAQVIDSSAPCPGQPRFQIQYLPNSVRVVVMPGLCGVSGDMDGNGDADAADVDEFIASIISGAPYQGCADANADCVLDGRDVNSYVQALLAP